MSTPSTGPITLMLEAAGTGDRQATENLLPLVYQELRHLAEIRLAKTPPGNTLQPTALVHEAYLRLVGSDEPAWNGRGHFFAAAAQAMRQVLVDQARRRASLKRGGERRRVDMEAVEPIIEPPTTDMLALDEALQELERSDPRQGRIVILRYFAGLSNEETAQAMNLSLRTVEREWRFARAYLRTRLSDSDSMPHGAVDHGPGDD